MCHPSWGRARIAARRLSDLARLRRIRDRIDREYEQPLNVEALARGVHMSAGHLSRQFRLAYGESPYAYLMTRRIERATALLRRGDIKVTDVCFAVGCSSLGTFTTRFTELVGMPPCAYKRRAAGAAHVLAPARPAREGDEHEDRRHGRDRAHRIARGADPERQRARGSAALAPRGKLSYPRSTVQGKRRVPTVKVEGVT